MHFFIVRRRTPNQPSARENHGDNQSRTSTEHGVCSLSTLDLITESTMQMLRDSMLAVTGRFPEEAGPHLESGWTKTYWEPLKAYLE